MKPYLCGPINGCSDEEATGWRTRAKALFPDALDPMRRDFRGQEAANVSEIVEGDKHDIDGCDALLVWHERPSVGTAMEVLYAWERGKRVVVIDRSGWPLSPWLVYHAHAVTTSLELAAVALGVVS